MPDIVSRIRVEAQGADQAAREIRKLRDAYNDVAQAGRNLSPAGVGADPFAQAISAPGGGVYGGQRAPADIADRQNTSRIFREDVQQRQVANSSYNQALRGGPGQIYQVAEQAAMGKGAGAVGGGLGILGSIAGAMGPFGVAIAALGGAAIVTQKLADQSFQRLQGMWGTGMTQRLNQRTEATQELMTGFARTGVPMEMVQGFFSSASRAGMTLDAAMLPATQMAMEAMAMTGVDPGAMASMLGAMSRGGIGSLGGQYNLYSMMKGTFGQANMGTFVQEITRATESSMQRGINVNPQEAIRQANLIGAYSQYGGLSPTGAAALSQMTLERGRNAAALSKPEDIIAFQMMRKADPSMSVSETMMAMEEAPTEVNRKVYQYLKGATGGDQELLRFRMKQYLGPTATMSQANAMIKSFESRVGLTPAEREQLAFGLDTQAWMGRTKDEETGKYISTSKERQVYAVRQLNALKGIQDAALDTTTAIKGLARILMGDIKLDALQVGFEGYRPDVMAMLTATQLEAQEETKTDLTAFFEETRKEAGGMSNKELQRLERNVQNAPIQMLQAGGAGAVLRKDPATMAYWQGMYERGGMMTAQQFEYFQERGVGATLGGWGTMVSSAGQAMLARGAKEARQRAFAEAGGKEVGGLAREEGRSAYNEFINLAAGLQSEIQFLSGQNISEAEAMAYMTRVLETLAGQGIVFTDGEAE